MLTQTQQSDVMIAYWQNKDMWWLKQSSPSIENATNYRVFQKESLSVLLNHFIQAYAVLDTLPLL